MAFLAVLLATKDGYHVTATCTDVLGKDRETGRERARDKGAGSWGMAPSTFGDSSSSQNITSN